jgi:hypothetical protein
MKARILLGWLTLSLTLGGCVIVGTPVNQPYESCAAGEACSGGTVCTGTTLPAAAGYTGAFCTTGCSVGSDCLMDLSNYQAECVNGQCYITCPTGGLTCPYGTGCLTFSDQAGQPINICTP